MVDGAHWRDHWLGYADLAGLVPATSSIEKGCKLSRERNRQLWLFLVVPPELGGTLVVPWSCAEGEHLGDEVANMFADAIRVHAHQS